MEGYLDTFGNVLKAIRKERKLTQKMLSQDICSQSVLSRIENGEELPNVLVMQQLCQRLGVTIDQVMLYNSIGVKETEELLEKMAYHFRQKDYKKLEELLKRPGLINQFYLDTDIQLYFYYSGSCEFFLHGNCEKALSLLKRGLSYTFKLDKMHVSKEEVQLISCIGKVYGDMGHLEEAEQYLKRSIHLFYRLPNQRGNAELTKIFYNYASFLDKKEQYTLADELVDCGIELARRKNSFYYLEELFQLKSKLLTQNERNSEALIYQQLSTEVRRIATFG
ncbi:Cro/Cl family transcriptional regulator [Enterococcus sp. JM4C]|uniref:helix-turn-helix domain-containing protein n=1 Tax=Candidatus Enterococcus huntleyi TaxID=1857217 RepID=UPI00137B1BCE|nr:helix-turn-helix transcriptional regulator [Enterococcus sp. JM4C]KAF1297712.1 Cro/Cl family transcriptional regulator [Enterococcus sp. JM4C]